MLRNSPNCIKKAGTSWKQALTHLDEDGEIPLNYYHCNNMYTFVKIVDLTNNNILSTEKVACLANLTWLVNLLRKTAGLARGLHPWWMWMWRCCMVQIKCRRTEQTSILPNNLERGEQ